MGLEICWPGSAGVEDDIVDSGAGASAEVFATGA